VAALPSGGLDASLPVLRTVADGLANFVESRVLEESEFLRSVVAHALALMRDEILDACKLIITEALSQRVRGTFDAKAKYVSNDVVACDGAASLRGVTILVPVPALVGR
jgi:uncharacterized protein YutE (UPF0331/DUF86 family)